MLIFPTDMVEIIVLNFSPLEVHPSTARLRPDPVGASQVSVYEEVGEGCHGHDFNYKNTKLCQQNQHKCLGLDP